MFIRDLPETPSAHLHTDSRQVSFPQNSLFFAIRGEHHDGHQFLTELYHRGVREFVVESGSLTKELRARLSLLTDARFYEVPDSIRALQQIVTRHRQQFTIPVIGITGSNGKTIVKEWLSQLLAPGEIVVASPKSYNSQIGVPLSVWNLKPVHTLAIFEAGISQPMEMINLQPVIDPTVGIFTTIGPAHAGGFKSLKQKITEKLKLFVKSRKLIYRTDYRELSEEIAIILQPVNPELQVLGWSTDQQDVPIRVRYSTANSFSYIHLEGLLGTHRFRVPFTDEASLENLTHCLVFLLDYGLDVSQVQERLMTLRPVSMRLELKEGVNGSYLIDDAYNNDLQGLAIALNFLKRQEQRAHRTVILSDILQSGQPSDELYTLVGEMLREAAVDQFIGIGPEISRFGKLITIPDRHFFLNTSEFLANYSTTALADRVILLKGARPFSFERIVSRLQQKVHSTKLEINLDALTHNLNYYREKVGPETKIMAMVKAFAYGSGSAEIAGLLQYHRVDYLGVAYADEGILLRQSGISLPIMVMNVTPETFPSLLHYHLEPELYSRNILKAWLLFTGRQADLPPPIHIKLDTGMHRLGFTEQDYEWLSAQLQAHPTLQVASIFSHLAGADEGAHNPFSLQQYERFMQGALLLENTIARPVLKHLLNSAGIVRFPAYKMDMVRLGIGLYGIEATGQEQARLQTVGTLKTVISQIKTVPAGETVGYSRRGVLDHDARIATIALGYADGFDRRFGNGNGQVSVNGVKCPTVGNICMDMTMVDVTGAPAEEGDEVIIFGEEIPVWQLAANIGTIPYELFTGVSERVKRVFYKE